MLFRFIIVGVLFTLFTQSASAQVALPARSITYVPPLTCGDPDYGGDGPIIRTRVELFVPLTRRNEVWAKVTVLAEESDKHIELEKARRDPKFKPNRNHLTTAFGTQCYRVARARFPINAIVGPTVFVSTPYIDHDHKYEVVPSTCPFIRAIGYVGDTKGPEAGTKTGVTIYFDRICVR